MENKNLNESPDEEVEDLFAKYKELPQEVQDVLEKHMMIEDYEDCEKLVHELESIGWTCNYGLDAIPYDLRKL